MENKAILQTSELITKGIRKSKKGPRDEKLQELIVEAKTSILRLQNLRSCYQFVTDDDLIECTIYMEKAEEERVSYLLRRIKELQRKNVI